MPEMPHMENPKPKIQNPKQEARGFFATKDTKGNRRENSTLNVQFKGMAGGNVGAMFVFCRESPICYLS